nr:hypothetical protein MarFTME_195 [Marseillevirus futianmevirus]
MSKCLPNRCLDIVCSCGHACEQDEILGHLGEHQEKMEFCAEVPEQKVFYCGPCNLITKNLLTFKRHVAKKSHKAAATYAWILRITKDYDVAQREMFSNHDRKFAARFIEEENFRRVGWVIDNMRPANILKNE